MGGNYFFFLVTVKLLFLLDTTEVRILFVNEMAFGFA